ncbi:hypothetical protein [Streptomyces sp. NPDC059455]|uniref:hypothetical protein n=1 Tax=Streptomyces sp. NPDC059455 TaxID=3346837 RepID=UPI0036C2228D
MGAVAGAAFVFTLPLLSFSLPFPSATDGSLFAIFLYAALWRSSSCLPPADLTGGGLRRRAVMS